MLRLSDSISSLLKHKHREIWSVTPEQTVYEAIERMADTGVGALLVISQGKLVGIISERDYEAHFGRVHGHYDEPPHQASPGHGTGKPSGDRLDRRSGEVDHLGAGGD